MSFNKMRIWPDDFIGIEINYEWNYLKREEAK